MIRAACSIFPCCSIIGLCRLLVILLWLPVANAGDWSPLRDDGVHDPDNTAIQWLQNPAEALSRLPSDSAGNRVDWVRALRDGYIRPRSGLHKDASVKVLESEILLNNTGSLPRVLFPHRQHTQWLDCGNCHESIFRSKAGATPISMRKILDGQYCGVCHGAVSFPLTECNRCHSVPTGEQPVIQ